MRKLSLLALAVAAFASPAAAQDARPRIGVKAGWQWPSSDEFKDSFGAGWTLGVDLSARGRLLGLGVDARFSRKKTAFELPAAVVDLTWTSIPLSGNLYLNLFVDEGSTLYVGAGPSYLYTRIEGAAIGPGFTGGFSEGTWNWGWNAVAGADSGRIFLEAQLLRVSQSDPGGDSLQLGSLSLVLGYRF